jgi:hypothetical protein
VYDKIICNEIGPVRRSWIRAMPIVIIYDKRDESAFTHPKSLYAKLSISGEHEYCVVLGM